MHLSDRIVFQISMPKVVSFDLDGTLVQNGFADAVWLEGLPLLYAKEKQVPLDKAKKILFEAYDEITDQRVEWYDLSYWFKRYQLQSQWKALLESYQDRVALFPDVLPVLQVLQEHQVQLIICSNAMQEFITIQLKVAGIDQYFDQVFSSISDFSLVKKEPYFYQQVLDKLHLSYEQMIHVGDHSVFDYEAPRSVGITSYLIDREQQVQERNSFSSLTEVLSVINNFSLNNL